MKSKAINGGPCAACKSQRRRCSHDCQLAPFFPSDQPKLFEDSRRLFRVRNILKNLKRVGEDPFIRAETMWAITYESSLRAHDKVKGATGEIIKLCCEIQRTQNELDQVRAQIATNKVRHERGLLNKPASPVESDDGGSSFGGVMDEYLISFVGDSSEEMNYELKEVFLVDQIYTTDEEETARKLDHSSSDSLLESKLEPNLIAQNREIENELKSATTFLTLTNNVKNEEEIVPISEDF